MRPTFYMEVEEGEYDVDQTTPARPLTNWVAGRVAV